MTRTAALLAALALMTALNVFDTVRIFQYGSTFRAQRHALASQHLSQLESCARLNIGRVEENVARYAEYEVFKIVSVQSAVPRPGATAREQADTQAFLAPLRSALRVLTWTPRTNCGHAVNTRGVRYRSPHPVPFAHRLPPPDALTLYPGDFF